MDRFFEKISYEQFKKDISDNEELYNSFDLPSRATETSAGYDIKSLVHVVLKPGEMFKIPTGVKAKFLGDEVLQIYIRSSVAIKQNIILVNQVGIIDCDYYNNPENEGHIFLVVYNFGNEDYEINIGDRIAQGIFTKYLTCGEEVQRKRTGSSGSTGK